MTSLGDQYVASQLGGQSASDVVAGVLAPKPAPSLAPVTPAADELAEPGARVDMRDGAGNLVNIDARELPAALKRGYARLTPEELTRERDIEEIKGRTGGTAAAGLVGLAQSATLGTFKPAAIGLAGVIGGKDEADKIRRTLVAVEGASPIASTAGEIGGLAIGGLGSLGERVGVGAAKALGLGAAKAGFGQRVAAAGVKLAVDGALQGAALGAGEQLTEDALGDHETTAENLFSSAFKGGLLGGAGGGLLGAGGEVLATGARGVASLVRAKPGALATAADGLAGKAEAGAERIAKAPPSAEAAAERTYQALLDKQQSTEVKRSMQAAHDAAKALGTVDDGLDVATRSVAADLDKVIHVDEHVLPDIAFGEGKMKNMDRLVQSPDPDRALGSILGMRNGVEEKVAWLESLSDKGGSAAAVRKVRDGLASFDQKWSESAAMGYADKNQFVRDAFLFADKLKRDVGKSAGMGKAFRNDAEKVFFEKYHDLIKPLQDESLFGPAGAAQREINLATTTKLQTSQAFRESFLKGFGSEAGEGITRANGSSIKGYLADITSAGNDLKKEAFQRYLGGLRTQLDAVETHSAMSAAEKSQFATARKSIDALEKSMARAEQTAHTVAQTKAMLQGEAGGMLGNAAAVVGGTVGGMLGGVPGAIAGGGGARAFIEAATKPVTNAQRLGNLAREGAKADKLWREGVDGFMKRTGKPATEAPHLAASAIKKIAERVTKLASNADALRERMGQTFAGIGETAPKTATALGTLSARAMAFLATKAPKSIDSGASLTPHLGEPRYLDSDVAKFSRYWRAVSDPDAVVADLKKGTITHESVEVLRELFPKRYENLKAMVLDKLSEQRDTLPYEDRIALGILLGIPADSTLDQKFIQAMQATKAPDSGQKNAGGGGSPRGRNVKLDTNSMKTESEKVESR